MLYRKIDENGLFIEDVILSEPPVLTDEKGNTIADPQYIAETVPQGFYHPKWEGSEWVEGGTAPEPVPTQPTDLEILSQTVDSIFTEILPSLFE